MSDVDMVAGEMGMDELIGHIEAADKELTRQLRSALGAKDKPEIIELVRTEPEAERVAIAVVKNYLPARAEAVNQALGKPGIASPKAPAKGKGGLEF